MQFGKFWHFTFADSFDNLIFLTQAVINHRSASLTLNEMKKTVRAMWQLNLFEGASSSIKNLLFTPTEQRRFPLLIYPHP
jgi:hypothetical protein